MNVLKYNLEKNHTPYEYTRTPLTVGTWLFWPKQHHKQTALYWLADPFSGFLKYENKIKHLKAFTHKWWWRCATTTCELQYVRKMQPKCQSSTVLTVLEAVLQNVMSITRCSPTKTMNISVVAWCSLLILNESQTRYSDWQAEFNAGASIIVTFFLAVNSVAKCHCFSHLLKLDFCLRNVKKIQFPFKKSK